VNYDNWNVIVADLFTNESAKFAAGQSASMTRVNSSALPSPVQLWNGSSLLSAATIKSALTAAGFLAKVQINAPNVNTFDVQSLVTGTTPYLRILMWNSTNAAANLSPSTGWVSFELSTTPSQTYYNQPSTRTFSTQEPNNCP
jgi:hypothetical protein